MNQLVTTPAVQTMTSREIAELCDKRHDNVMRDIREMLVQLHGEGGVLIFEDTLRNEQNGQRYPIFRLPKRETLILVSGYRLDLRTKIIDRWQELETQASRPQVPQSLPEALRLAADLAEELTTAKAEIAIAAPKAKALDRIAKTDDSYTVTDAAKTLGRQPRGLLNWMRGPGRWVYRRAGCNHDVAYQDKLQKGWLVHRVITIPRDDGTDRTVMQIRVTAAGLAELAAESDLRDHPRVYAPNRIKELRESRGFTQRDLAVMMDVRVTWATVSKLENRRMALSVDYIRSIARALGVEESELIERPREKLVA